MRRLHNSLDAIPEGGMPPPPPSFKVQLSGEGYESIDPMNYFDQSQQISTSRGNFQIYTGGEFKRVVYLFIHGAGYSSLSFAEVIKVLKQEAYCVAIDLRSHGKSIEGDLIFQDLTLDINTVIEQLLPNKEQIPLIIFGHSLGGSLATAVEPQNCKLQGIVLIDISENVALQSLPNMQIYLKKKPKVVNGPEAYAEWLIRTNQLLRKESACIQAQNLVSEGKVITDLSKSEKYWEQWFKGMNERWINRQVWKMLLVSSMNKLDKDFEIAHMQGKMNVDVIRNCIHNLHEDSPLDFLQVTTRFLRRLHLSDKLFDREFDFKKPMPEDEKEMTAEEINTILK
ncbi:Protein phosphatase methylesterase 1 [Spironucleus salmonicida]|uniref:Protein phosphatase methylesterase 1 n=1 Tax=Spironucleus salmonicida TaxID=348837 RepID=V6LNC1_9EUKA|nr:Protein phosphatase methylesterase 1 [Spironucleus salmonicida]|eukprot:EST45211.1 Protein phosphatase methylesterase-1 [Spironucleus salmonicida]